MKTRTLMVVLPALIALASCNGGSTSGSQDGQTGGQAQLQGQWRSGCILAVGNESFRKGIRFEGNRFTAATYFYRDADCQKYEQDGESYSGTFSLSGESDVAGTFKIDFDGVDYADRAMRRYDLYRIEDGNLWFGNSPGDTENARATELDTSIVFQKQY
jgi:hypothetical protein